MIFFFYVFALDRQKDAFLRILGLLHTLRFAREEIMTWNSDCVGLPENFTDTGVTQKASENLGLMVKFPQL